MAFEEPKPVRVQKSSDRKTADFMNYPKRDFKPDGVRVQKSSDRETAEFMGYKPMDTQKAKSTNETARERERAIWTDVERVGRELRAADPPKQGMTQADRDAAKPKPTQGMSN